MKCLEVPTSELAPVAAARLRVDRLRLLMSRLV
jgi:hypothetical protein